MGFKIKNFDVGMMIKFSGMMNGIMSNGSSVVTGSESKFITLTPEESESPYYVNVLTIIFKNEADAKAFMDFDNNLDDAIGEF